MPRPPDAVIHQIASQISNTYPEQHREDVYQEVWLACLELNQPDEALNFKTAKYAAMRFMKRERLRGFRPERSKYEPPVIVQGDWQPSEFDANEDNYLDGRLSSHEPAYNKPPDDQELVEHMKAFSSEEQARVIEAASSLHGEHNISELVRRTGLPRHKVLQAIESLRKRFHHD